MKTLKIGTGKQLNKGILKAIIGDVKKEKLTTRLQYTVGHNNDSDQTREIIHISSGPHFFLD